MSNNWVPARIDSLLREVEDEAGVPLEAKMRRMVVLAFCTGFADGVNCVLTDEPEVIKSKLRGACHVE